MDVLLIVSFGGPQGPGDVVPFLENVTRGRGIPRARLVEVGAHYGQFGGVSPLNALNRDLVERVGAELGERDTDVPVLWGNRNWDPYLVDALRSARGMGATRIFAFLTSAYSSYSGCRQYRENLHDALAAVRAEDPAWDPQLHKLRTYFNHPGFVAPFAEAAAASLAALPAGSRLVFTTHSIPTADAQRCDYVAQHRDVAATIAAQLGRADEWDLVYQSRSGAPHIPWLEPDISDHLATLADSGVPGAAMVPIGFISDHMEVIWDLDTVATRDGGELGLAVARAATPGTDPRFISMVVDLFEEARVRTDGGDPEEAVIGALGPRAVPCAAGCCPNPRAPRPAACGYDERTPAWSSSPIGSGSPTGASPPAGSLELPAELGLTHDRLALAWSAARAAGDLLNAGRTQSLTVSTKTTRTDVVTQMDTAAETSIVNAIVGAFPDDGILGEEGADRPATSGVRWVIDPLDGTVNYLYGLPGWAVSIAVEVDGRVEVGVVDVPRYAETFVAVRGQGAVRWADGQAHALVPNAPDELGQALVATGFGYDARRRAAQARTLAEVLPAVRDIRRAGAAAVDLCWAADGRVDCYYERGLNPWDLAAGVLVATEAGMAAGGPGDAEPSGELTWLAPQHLAGLWRALLAHAGADRD